MRKSTHTTKNTKVKEILLKVALDRGLWRMQFTKISHEMGIRTAEMRRIMDGRLVAPEALVRIARWCGMSVEELFGDGDGIPDSRLQISEGRLKAELPTEESK